MIISTTFLFFFGSVHIIMSVGLMSKNFCVKNLGTIYKDLKEFSGATILGDGTVVLILDLNQLFKKVEDQDRRKHVGRLHLVNAAFS